MSRKPVVFRKEARRDYAAAFRFFLVEAGEATGRDFRRQLLAATAQIREHPGIGSTRYAADYGFEGIRAWRLKRFPYLVLYIESAERIEVARILHAHRDIPRTLQDPEPD